MEGQFSQIDHKTILREYWIRFDNVKTLIRILGILNRALE